MLKSRIMKLWHASDPFQISRGSAAIVVGAPHHGSRPNVEADCGTGPITLALAGRLKGNSVVVSDMRRLVDVNKDPRRLDKHLRHHAIRYQNEIFAGRPGLIIEIHGHTTGHHDIEVSTGFELDLTIPADCEYLEKLSLLRQMIPAGIQSRLGRRPTVGVWPLDRDVAKTATNTFTFQKVRRARHLAGLNWYGLHIEINAALRVGQGNQIGNIKQLSPQVVQALADAIADAIQQSFEPLPPKDSSIPLHNEANAEGRVLSEQSYSVSRMPDGYISDNYVLLHPDSLNDLGALEGDTVIIKRNEDELSSQVVISQMVPKDQAGITSRMLNQVNAKPGQKVTLIRLAKHISKKSSQSDGACITQAMVAHQIWPDKLPKIWLSSNELECFNLKLNAPTRIAYSMGLPVIQIQKLDIEESLPLHAVMLSQGLANKLGITLGETLRLDQAEHG